MSWVEKLKSRWGLTSVWQVILVLVVFSCTGFSVLLIKQPLIDFLFGDAEHEWWMTTIYYLLILPMYNVMLLGYGCIFGQFQFFWNYEKKTVRRIGKLFRIKRR